MEDEVKELTVAQTRARKAWETRRKNKSESVPHGTVAFDMASISNLVMDAVRAAKEPDPEVLEKKAEEKRRREQVIAENLETARIEMQAKIDRENSCSHMKENGRPCTGGQVHSDGMFHEFCLRCQKVIRVYKPAQENMMYA